ncbi:hypothetical protein KIN20_003109 [Parelaphostrongylus tenuis]|uniref:Uncharacterized protein n=1 Tax=Parelaphostrongylus tenuis TaxID=148309 RepID=A0AAD5M0U7_PARTN|nr:hypothetical protein KIN20_003109 [Parelaphostrongylus tenuis]
MASPEAAGGIILSPNVLSPHILGGAHTREEASHEVVQIGDHSDDGESDELESATAPSTKRGQARHSEVHQ